MQREQIKKLYSKAQLALIILGLILPPVLCLFYIKAYSVNVPIWDQFNFVPLFDKAYTGNLSVVDFFTQHNEHRIFFPRLMMLSLGMVTHYNTIAEMFLSWFLLCLIGYLLFKFYKRIFGVKRSTLIMFIPVVWLLFSWRQYENLLWGWQCQFFMTILFLLLSFYLLETSTNLRWRFVLSLVSGVVCSFSLSVGLLVWPIGFLQILYTRWWQGRELNRLYIEMVLVWSLIGIFVYVAYFIGYHHPVHHPSIFYFIEQPLSALLYFLACLGSPLGNDIYGIIGTGIVLSLLYLCVIGLAISRESRKQHYISPSFSLILFTVLSAVAATLGRAGFGVEQAITSRYTTLTILGVIGLYIVVISLKLKAGYHSIKPFFVGGLLSLIILGIIVTYGHAIVAGRDFSAHRNLCAYYLATYKVQSDENLARIFSVPEVVREGASILEKHKLNVFYKESLKLENLSITNSSTTFNIDTVLGRPLTQLASPIIVDAQHQESITISGWAVDQSAGKAAGGVFINIDGQIDIPAVYGLHRQDVADHFQNPQYKFSGFSASFATSILGQGKHVLSIRVVGADEKSYYEADQKIVLEVK